MSINMIRCNKISIPKIACLLAKENMLTAKGQRLRILNHLNKHYKQRTPGALKRSYSLVNELWNISKKKTTTNAHRLKKLKLSLTGNVFTLKWNPTKIWQINVSIILRTATMFRTATCSILKHLCSNQNYFCCLRSKRVQGTDRGHFEEILIRSCEEILIRISITC